MAGQKKLRVTLVRGFRGRMEKHRATVRGLGLKWRSHTVEVEDSPQTRGMINTVAYMLKVTEVKG
jgi:large subunit ribosomal protein L30